MKFRLLLLSALAAAMLPAGARTLTPEEALARLSSDSPAPVRKISRTGAAAPAPAYTASMESGRPLLYVFNSAKEAGDGYIIVSADDCAAPLLGYSETGTFEASEMPDNMKWWLSQYEAQIAAASAAGKAYTAPAKVAERTPIAPMVKTRWNQDAPYNNRCPQLTNGSRAATGCAATAMAQVMAYHQWPAKGTGYLSYKWNNRTLSINLSATPLEWDKMLDVYGSDASEESCSAVATLMYACGVSTEMNYGAASSTTTYAVAKALIDNFDYDASLKLVGRRSYNSNDWEDMIYNSLSSSGPVFYAGSGNAGGHAFVCDGYSSNRYFHFNWGWGGMSDGYFLLTALDPSSLGIGGGAGGFNDNQEVILGVERNHGGSPAQYNIACAEIFGAQVSGQTLALSGFFYNPGLGVLSAELGARFVNEASGQETVVMSGSRYSFQPATGIDNFSIYTASIPAGTYKVYPVYTSGSGDEVFDVLTPANQPGYAVYVKSANGTATVEVPNYVSGLKVDSFSLPRPIYLGRPFEVEATFTNDNNAPVMTTVYPFVFDSNGRAVANGDGMIVNLDANETKTITFVSGSLVSESTLKAGSYLMALAASYGDTENGPSLAIQSQLISIRIIENPGNGTLVATSWSVENADNLDPENISVTVDLSCTKGYYSEEIAAAIFDMNSSMSVDAIQSPMVLLAAGDKKTVKFTGTFPGAVPGEQYFILPFYNTSSGTVALSSNMIIVTIRKQAGIGGSEVAAPAATVYPNPAGSDATVSVPAAISALGVYALSGAGVSVPCEIEGREASLDVSGLQSGVYIVAVVCSDGSTHSMKLVKK